MKISRKYQYEITMYFLFKRTRKHVPNSLAMGIPSVQTVVSKDHLPLRETKTYWRDGELCVQRAIFEISLEHPVIQKANKLLNTTGKLNALGANLKRIPLAKDGAL